MSHLFDSLKSAADMVVKQDGYRRCEINLSRWAETYRTSPDDVEQALQIAENGERKLPEEEAASSLPPPPPEEIQE